MCGIVGYLGDTIGPDAAESVLRAMAAAVAHRGPDEMGLYAEGEIALGHRRLSIVGLADGQQPMLSDDGNFVISFNGEIFNYIELRAELAAHGHHLRTGSDTEVLLRVRSTYLTENFKPKFLKPGESYTNSATFSLPESISGSFHIIVKTDTSTTKDFYRSEPSTIRVELDTVSSAFIRDAVLEFKDEGNNVASIPLPITLA